MYFRHAPHLRQFGVIRYREATTNYNQIFEYRTWTFRRMYPSLIPKHTILSWKDHSDKPNTVSTLLLCLNVEGKVKNHTIALRRPITEEFGLFASKLQTKISNSNSDDALTVQYDPCVEEKGLEMVLDEITSLKIGDDNFRVLRDPVDAVVSLPMAPREGCPLIPVVDLKNANEKCPSSAVFHWFTQIIDPPLSSASKDECSKKKKKDKQPSNVPQVVEFANEEKRLFHLPGCEFRYIRSHFVPSVEDIGKRVVVVVDFGPDAIVRSGGTRLPVEALDHGLLCRNRIKWCQETPAAGAIRVISYNILADLYLNLSGKQEELFFPYCPKEFQSAEYRYPLLLHEIEGYNGDLYFLQEVDYKMQYRYLSFLYRTMGLDMIFAKKGEQVSEGTLIAYRTDRFSVSTSTTEVLSTFLEFETNKDVKSLLETSSESMRIFMSRPTIVQIVVLRDKISGTLFVCGNTHLHHNPAHEHIKALQALVAYRRISEVRDELISSNSSTSVRVLFGGDFNSLPSGPAFRLFTEGLLPKTDQCWELDRNIQPEDLKSSGSEEGFSGCLDYVWTEADIGLRLVRTAPWVDHEDVVKHLALPSKIAPSDHLPLILDITTPSVP